ncbi:MAG: glycosyltransferase family 4 protein [Nostocaceae cyanobacterium]|nr:glycosyltransferase family 4 protein [Nostocaceae cyanobacterium]
MRKPVLTIFYQFNPWQPSIGGIQTLINSFLKYAPSEFDVRMVGTGNDASQPVGKWQAGEFAGREIRFFPLLTVPDDNIRKPIPTTLKYTTALLGRCFASDFMHFYRLEPTLASLNWRGEKTLFIQNDIRQQMSAKNDKKAILWRHFPAAYFAMERLLVGQFQQIFSCNSDSAELYRQYYPWVAERVAFLKNTYDEEIFYPLFGEERLQGRRELAEKLGVSEDTNFILFAGRLHPQKDPLLLIRSVAALADPKVHLLIAGEGEMKDEISAEVGRLGLEKQVTMLGAVSQLALAQLHRVCNAFILTSAYEGLPFVVLEALASGTPIVTTNCGETPKILSENSGVVCEERTPEAIAAALTKVLHHPEDYPTAACVRTAQPYAAGTVIRNIYNQMLERWERQTLLSVNS